MRRQGGFTLLEVLVALFIVATALGASLRAVGNLTGNSADLRATLLANWSAENRLAQIRLAREWPAPGQRQSDCPQGELALRCQETVSATQNPYFRQIEIKVFDPARPNHALVRLNQVVPNER